MSLPYEPSRGGSRGGKDQFSWDKVKLDKDREHYLGHSLLAPLPSQIRYQFDWYTKEKKSSQKDSVFVLLFYFTLKEVMSNIKDIESEAMAAALGSTYAALNKTPFSVPNTQNRMMFTPAHTTERKVETKKGVENEHESRKVGKKKKERSERHKKKEKRRGRDSEKKVKKNKTDKKEKKKKKKN